MKENSFKSNLGKHIIEKKIFFCFESLLQQLKLEKFQFLKL